MELEPGAIMAGKLRLLSPLGQGGMGVVWAARHLTLATDVAVKLIRPERAAKDPAAMARFEREARATARIAHPNVVRVMDYGAVDGAVPYIVMELLRGFSLADLLERGGRLSFATTKSLVQQIGSALESAHEQGVVHRDIKPHNVFITEGSKGYPLFVKVLDFGVAKMLGDSDALGGSLTLTETGMVIGSAPYMSPEQLEGRKDVDLRSDLWSLAVIVYEALTGAQPFQGGSFVSVGAAVLNGRYRPASELRPDLPSSIDHWFAKALCLDPDGRFQSAREMIAAFSELESASEEPEASHEEEPPEGRDWPRPPAREPQPDGFETKETAPAERGPRLAEADTDSAAAAGGTVIHAPLVKKPDAVAPPKPRLLRAATAFAIVIAAAGAGAVRLWGPLRPGAGAGCPAGMVLIEGATFSMGSPEGGETPEDETPLHEVAVKPFCLDRTEVTAAAYSQCESCGAAPTTVDIEGLTTNGRSFWSQFCNRPGEDDHPVNCVDLERAKTYCASLGKRLPTEAEWELAARGKDARTYPWGFTPPGGERLNACGTECSRMLTERLEKVGKGSWPAMHNDDDTAPSTAPVGHYLSGASPAGVLDLAGNVWEWTDSHYCPYGKEDCDDSRRVLRGGGWDTVESQYVRSAHRRPSAPAARGWSIGFRCAKAP